MQNGLFYKLGKRVGKSWYQGRYLFESLSGNSEHSLHAEYEFGAILAREIERENPVSEVSTELLLAESVLRRLQKKVKNKQRYFNLKVLTSNDLNAFALPGGFIYITSALLQKMSEDADALAFILAHEMVHVVLKHPLKRMMTSYSLDIMNRVLKSGSVLGVIGKEVLNKIIRSHYSQENELMADEYGLRLMFNAGFDPNGAIRLLSFFKKENNKDGYRYFSTHPPLSRRIQNLNNLMKI